MPRVPLPLVLLLSAMACQPQAGQLSDADVAAIAAVAASLDAGALAHDWDAVFELFADDAVSMAQGYSTLEGRAAIRRAVEEAMAGLTVTGHEIVFETVEGRSDVAYVTGTYLERYAVADADQPIEVRGRIVAVLRKQTSGDWRIVVWSTNTES
jgi:uncharacterized protein (TIGR02246 family)